MTPSRLISILINHVGPKLEGYQGQPLSQTQRASAHGRGCGSARGRILRARKGRLTRL